MKPSLPSLDKIYTAYMYSYPHKTAYKKLENIKLEDFADKLNGELCSAYFHIPFCESKCGYCNLFSVSSSDSLMRAAYVNALRTQARQMAFLKPKWQSLIIGGGTPLFLSKTQLEDLFEIAQNDMNIPVKDVFSCIETAPAQTSAEKIDVLRKWNIKRVSIGVQSFLEEDLKTLGRLHSQENSYTALERLSAADFPCLNIDLIYGIPGQTAESLKYSLKEALRYVPDEIFLYPLYRRSQMRIDGVVQNPESYNLYVLARDLLLSEGYSHISMRQFSKTPPEVLWSCSSENTISVGCGGRSYIENLHFCTPYTVDPEMCRKTVQDYIAQPNKTKITNGFCLETSEQKRRFVIKNLLHASGLEFALYEKLFSSDVNQDFPILQQWKNKGYVLEDENKLRLSAIGLSLSDYLGPLLISEEVNHLMLDWRETHDSPH